MSSCPSGKAQFASEAAAKQHLGRKGGFRVRAYLCPDCHFVHVAAADKAGWFRSKIRESRERSRRMAEERDRKRERRRARRENRRRRRRAAG